MRDQIIPDSPSQVDIMMNRDQESLIVKKGLKIQNSQDSFKGKPT